MRAPLSTCRVSTHHRTPTSDRTAPRAYTPLARFHAALFVPGPQPADPKQQVYIARERLVAVDAR